MLRQTPAAPGAFKFALPAPATPMALNQPMIPGRVYLDFVPDVDKKGQREFSSPFCFRFEKSHFASDGLAKASLASWFASIAEIAGLFHHLPDIFAAGFEFLFHLVTHLRIFRIVVIPKRSCGLAVVFECFELLFEASLPLTEGIRDNRH